MRLSLACISVCHQFSPICSRVGDAAVGPSPFQCSPMFIRTHRESPPHPFSRCPDSQRCSKNSPPIRRTILKSSTKAMNQKLQCPSTSAFLSKYGKTFAANLYPSQLSRLSMASKTLNTIVSSLPMWSRLFSLSFGPKKRLRLLVTQSEARCYMLSLCASSRHICENCRSVVLYDRRTLSQLPLPTLIPIPTRSTDEIEYLGEKLNEDWTIRMCLTCRKLQPMEPVPRSIVSARRTVSQLQQLYPGYVHPIPADHRHYTIPNTCNFHKWMP